MDVCVPAQAGGVIGVITGDIGIPAAGNAVRAAVLPIHTPAADGTGGCIGNTDNAGKTIVPLIADDVLALGKTVSRK